MKHLLKNGLAAVAVVSLVSLLALAGCKKKPGNPLPDSNAVSGWEKTSETRTFAAKDLWQYIDGDAEQTSRPESSPHPRPTTSTRANWKPSSTSTPWEMPPAQARFSTPGRPRKR